MRGLGRLAILTWFSLGHSLPQPPQYLTSQGKSVDESASQKNEQSGEDAYTTPAWSARCINKEDYFLCPPPSPFNAKIDPSRQSPAAGEIDLDGAVAITATGLTLGGLALWGYRYQLDPGKAYIEKELKALDKILPKSDPHYECMKKCVTRILTEDVAKKGKRRKAEWKKVMGEYGVYNLCAYPHLCNLPSAYRILRPQPIDPEDDADQVTTVDLAPRRSPRNSQRNDGRSRNRNNDPNINRSQFTQFVDSAKAVANDAVQGFQNSFSPARTRQGAGFGGTFKWSPVFPRR